MTKSQGLRIRELSVFGADKKTATILFEKDVKVVNGASNTGKSFLLSLIDYMLGKEDLKLIKEAAGYSECRMKLYINDTPFFIIRKFNDETFQVYRGHEEEEDSFYSYFKIGNETKTVKNISNFYFKELGLNSVTLAKNRSAKKESLTIRTLSRSIRSDEKSIIDDVSPILTPVYTEDTKYQSVFKFLLTGKDDSDLETLVSRGAFTSEKKGKISILEDLIVDLKEDLTFPKESVEDLKSSKDKLQASIEETLNSVSEAEKSLLDIVNTRKIVSKELDVANYQVRNLTVNNINFNKLNALYVRDIERLSSQEEAAFLLTVGHNGECGVCGHSSENICQDIRYIDELAVASLAEIEKIKIKREELLFAIETTNRKKILFEKNVLKLDDKLKTLDEEAENRSPIIKLGDENLGALRKQMSKVSADLYIQKKITRYETQLQENELEKAPKPYGKEKFLPESSYITDFCLLYKKVLDEIKFPGAHNVEFDFDTYDVVIDGNPRDSNGKGVKAILHSVFKIALLIHCREKGLFHPGLLILDSPLVTYRDPVKHRMGDLEDDELALKQTSVRYNFLDYLSKISHLAQFIIIENIDIPEALSNQIEVETFYGKGNSELRTGFF
ncbi:Rad50/SbcC-type AAA domain-containing protein [Vibrio crassostreae]|nr:Rad50/SbcC-type AAA domain-containing protein [Vibrio crassostreae]